MTAPCCIGWSMPLADGRCVIERLRCDQSQIAILPVTPGLIALADAGFAAFGAEAKAGAKAGHSLRHFFIEDAHIFALATQLRIILIDMRQHFLARHPADGGPAARVRVQHSHARLR